MYDLWIGLGESLVKHGLSLPFWGAALFIVLKQRPSKRWMRKHFPRIMKADIDETRQIRTEKDVRETKAIVIAIAEHVGVDWWKVVNEIGSTVNTEKSSSTLSQLERLSARFAGKSIMRRMIRMREYLKKLGRTKLQMVLLATFVNLALLIGYVMNVQDIQEKVEAWTPLVNMGIQTVLTFLYVWVEGKIDVAKAQAEVKDDSYTTPTEPNE